MGIAPYIEQLRLTRFKSFRDAVLPMSGLTLLIGRNGSGKSNAIDGIHVLARLADGDDIREAVDGTRRDAQEVRGGVAGCAPRGEQEFELGCTVVNGDDRLLLDVVVQVEPEVQIRCERLVLRRGSAPARELLVTDRAGVSDIRARYHNAKRGPEPALAFRSDRLLTAQVPSRVPSDSSGAREVIASALAVVTALRSVFILDPVPHLMRQYVNERDVVLRRDAENLSAVIGALRDDPMRWERLKELVQGLSEHEVSDVVVERSQLGDVMVALRERFRNQEMTFSARVMSDGMLRFLAFAAALLESRTRDSPAMHPEDTGRADTLLVIEEIENGLHPSQAARLVELIEAESKRRPIRTFATTHSPAILTALASPGHEGVVVCRRNRAAGTSQLVRLVDLPGYPQAMAAGSLGDAVTELRLEAVPDAAARARVLDRLLTQM